MSNADAILNKIAKKTKIGEYNPYDVVTALNNADLAAAFEKDQKADLQEAEARLASMEGTKRAFEKKIAAWTPQPLPGMAASISMRLDAVAAKLLA